MAREIITAGSAPVVWSTVSEAFDKINNNFTELYATVGGGTPFDFSQISTDLSPKDTGTYDLGSPTKRWKTVYVGNFGVSIGGATINSLDGVNLNLPSGTTVGGELIRNPDESSFKTFAVSGQDDVVANNFSGTVNLASGGGLSITTNGITDTITFTNSGVTNAIAGSGISLSSSTGAITISNGGVTGITAGAGITASASTGAITITNSGVISVVTDPGSGIGLDTSVPGVVRVSNTLPSTLINAFRLITVSGEVNVTAQNSADTLTLIKGSGIDISTTLSKEITFTNTGVTQLATSGPGLNVSSSTGNITISFDNNIDIVGSVFADDSSVMVNAVDNSLSSNTLNVTTGNITDLSTVLFSTNSITAVDSSGVNIAAGGNNNLVVLETSVELQNVPVNVASNLTVSGNITGYHIGDMTGSVFSDGSTMLVDGMDGKIVGPIESPSVYGTTYIQTAVYADASAISTAIPSATKGMIVFNDDTGKFQGWDGSAWQDLN